MADNVEVTPGSGATIAADEVVDSTLGTVKVQMIKLMDATIGGTNKAVINSAGALITAGRNLNPTANFTRPADTTAYASGDLVANSTTAGSVDAMALTVQDVTAGSVTITGGKLHKSGTSTTNAQFRVHLFRADPATVTNGDNGAFSVSGVADYLGSMDITIGQAFTDGAAGFGTLTGRLAAPIKLAAGTAIYALLEARAAYTPGNAEVFTLTLDAVPE